MRFGRFLLLSAAIPLLAACGASQPVAKPAPAPSRTAGTHPVATTKPQPAKLKKVTMRLDWIYQGPNIGFAVARTMGFYKKAGLDVTIKQGKGSTSTAEVVSNGSQMFGMADGFVVAGLVAKGAPIEMVASIYRKNPNAVVVLKGSGIRTPKQLDGKSIGQAVGGTGFLEWPAFEKACGLNPKTIRNVSIQPTSMIQSLLAHKVSAIAGYAQGFVPTIEVKAHQQARIFWYANCGVTAISNGIIVRKAYAKAHPNTVRRFVAASIEGFLYARRHPNKAVAILKAHYLPTIVPAVTLREMQTSWQTWVPPSTKGRPLGWMAPQDWAATLKVLHEYGGVANPPAPDQVYTNAFVPTAPQFVPPQGA